MRENFLKLLDCTLRDGGYINNWEWGFSTAKTIINFIKEKNISVYNEEKQTGLVRHIVIKVGKYTNQVMCILVVNSRNYNSPIDTELVDLLRRKYPEIKTIIKNIPV